MCVHMHTGAHTRTHEHMNVHMQQAWDAVSLLSTILSIHLYDGK